jgi:NAD(P)-dependent dehydrogenase (short-subunit alcohol dehydrogenase family)
VAKLAGRVAIVTGAGRGIGKGIATKLAKEGAKVVVASRTASSVQRLVANLTDLGHIVIGVQADVGKRHDIARMVIAATSAFGRVDILVNNAQSWGLPGRNDPSPPQNLLADLDEVGWDYAYQTGLKGSLYGMCAVLPVMRDHGWGRIVNVYSPAAQQATPGLAAYNCAKEAILSLTRTAAREWAPHGITVNCISPAIVNDAVQGRFDAIADPDERQRVQQSIVPGIPMGHLGDAEHDAGSAVAFLVSDEARFVTGVSLRVDGGLAI